MVSDEVELTPAEIFEAKRRLSRWKTGKEVHNDDMVERRTAQDR
jgi:hypothetical protein